MATANNPYGNQLRTLAELMMAVCGESVAMLKRKAPEQAMKLKRQDEWGLYLEFLKILFNLSDRLSALHIPIQEQPQFMDNLEDAVTDQLKAVLEPAFGAGTDQMEIVLTVGKAVTESRQTYDHYRFLITEDGKTKNEMFKDFGERVAEKMGASGHAEVAAAAVLCVNAVVPSLAAIMEGKAPEPKSAGPFVSEPSQISAAQGPGEMAGSAPSGNEIKLVSVMASVSGEEVETRWGLHPRFKQDLKPDEAQELTKLMNQVAKILGERYASVAFSEEWTSWHRAGHA
ncbi:MAG: hypothetical protein ACT4OO_02790 [Nitrospiraceae bacterium]